MSAAAAGGLSASLRAAEAEGARPGAGDPPSAAGAAEPAALPPDQGSAANSANGSPRQQSEGGNDESGGEGGAPAGVARTGSSLSPSPSPSPSLQLSPAKLGSSSGYVGSSLYRMFDTNFGGALGGAVDIVAVRQRDGSVRTTPFYVRFGKFQGVLKSRERIVHVDVNGERSGVEMAISNSGEAYFVDDEPTGAGAAIGGDDEAQSAESTPSGTPAPPSAAEQRTTRRGQRRSSGRRSLPTVFSSEALQMPPHPAHLDASAAAKLQAVDELGFDRAGSGASGSDAGACTRPDDSMVPSWERPGVGLAGRNPDRTVSMSEEVLAHALETGDAAEQRVERQRRDAHMAARALLGEADPLPVSLCAAALRHGAPADRAFDAARLKPEVVATLGRRARENLVFRTPEGNLVSWPDVQEAVLRSLVGADAFGNATPEALASLDSAAASGIEGSDLSDTESLSGSWYGGSDFGSRAGRERTRMFDAPPVDFKDDEVAAARPVRSLSVGSDEDEHLYGALEEGADSQEPSSPTRTSWSLWPFSRSRSTGAVDGSTAHKPGHPSPETPGSPTQLRREQRRSRYRRRQERLYRPTRTQMDAIAAKLKDGHNLIKFTFDSNVWGTQEVESNIYLWHWDSKLVITDVDGTITRSDVLGQIMPAIGRDWSQPDVTNLLNSIVSNGYRLIYLSARALVQASRTRAFISEVRQGGLQLPDGPVLLSPDGLMPALYREVIQKRPQDFKIACLGDVRDLFPAEWFPFYAGFGNRPTDVLAYRAVGVPSGRCFTINPSGTVSVYTGGDGDDDDRVHRAATEKAAVTATKRAQAKLLALGSYAGIDGLCDQVFPPVVEVSGTRSTTSEADVPTDDRFDSFAYWRSPTSAALLSPEDLEALG